MARMSYIQTIQKLIAAPSTDSYSQPSVQSLPPEVVICVNRRSFRKAEPEMLSALRYLGKATADIVVYDLFLTII